MVDKFQRYHSALSWIAKNSELYRSSRHRALEILASKCAEVMNVDRVGIWFYTIDKEAIYEEMTCVVNNGTSQGTILKKAEFPVYFQHISQERVVAINDVLSEHATTELVKSYMAPLKIRAILDAPIFSDGEMIGVVCIEQSEKPRDWDMQDRNSED
jgi:GAF domain-containing protein